MFDLLVVAAMIAFAVRGYLRGVVRESIELLALLISIPLGFRLGGHLGRGWFADMAPVFGALLGTVLIITLGGFLAGIFGRRIVGKAYRPQPAERSVATAVGTIRGLVLVTVATVVASAAMPGSAPARLVSNSWFADFATGVDGPVLGVLAIVSGDEDLITVVRFNRSFDGSISLAEDHMALPQVALDRLEVDRKSAFEILAMVNLARGSAGVPQLQWADGLAGVGEAYAIEMYTDGFFSHDSLATGDVGDRARAAGIGYRLLGENLALAPNPEAVHTGLMNSPGHRANIMDVDFRSLGIGVVRGPLGLMVVQIFSG